MKRSLALLFNVARVGLLVAVIYMIWLMYTEIEAVKFLAYDQCAYCMNKTGAICFNPEVFP